MAKSVLILSLTCDIDCYVNEEKIIRKTWGKEIFDGKLENFDLFFMHSSDKDFVDFENNIIYTDSPDTYNGTGVKMIKSLNLIRNYKEHDYVILTNTATVLNLKLISKFINSDVINDNKIYGGIVIFPAAHIPYFRGDFILLNKNHIECVIKGYEKAGEKEHPNDELIFEYLVHGSRMFQDGKTLENVFMQIKSIDDFNDLKIEKVGSNFYINTKLLDRQNNDIIIANIISSYYLIKSDKADYDFKEIVHEPDVIRTNKGLYRIEMIKTADVLP